MSPLDYRMYQELEDHDYPLEVIIIGMAQLLSTGLDVNSIDSYSLLKLRQAVDNQLELLKAKIH